MAQKMAQKLTPQMIVIVLNCLPASTRPSPGWGSRPTRPTRSTGRWRHSSALSTVSSCSGRRTRTWSRQKPVIHSCNRLSKIPTWPTVVHLAAGRGILFVDIKLKYPSRDWHNSVKAKTATSYPIHVSMGYENGILSNKNSNLIPYPCEFGV